MSKFPILICALLLAAGVGATSADEYPFDIAKSHRAAFKAWQAIVPRDLRKQAWLYRFDGTAGPIGQTTLQGRTFLSGSVCIPHDCYGNFVAFLLADDGSAAFGELASDTLHVKSRFFGAPDEETKAELDKLLNPQ